MFLKVFWKCEVLFKRMEGSIFVIVISDLVLWVFFRFVEIFYLRVFLLFIKEVK